MIDFIYDLMLSATFCISMTIIFIILVKKLLKRFVSPRLNYALWLLIILQLIIPIRIDLNMDSEIPEYVQEAVSPIIHEENVTPVLETNVISEKTISFKPIAVAVWFIGCGISILVYIFVYIRELSKKHMCEAKDQGYMTMLTDIKKRLGVKKHVRLFYSSKEQSPYVIGIFRPKIIMPKIDQLENKKLLEYVLLHELCHIKKHDLLFKTFYLIFTVLFWFNPIVWIGFKVFSDDQEFDCDYQVLKILDDRGVLSYGHALLDSAVLFKQNHSYAFSNSLLNKKFIGRRIHMISNHHKYTLKRKLFSSTIIIILSLLMIVSGPALAINNDSEVETKDEDIDILQTPESPEVIEISDPEVGFQMMWPVESHRISNPYGERNLGFHTGIDIAAQLGEDIYAAQDGVVVYSGFKGTYGYMVIINHNNDVSTSYAHCSKLLVNAGEKVAKGEVIGYVGNTGRSTGPHLHFEVRENDTTVDPMDYYDDL